MKLLTLSVLLLALSAAKKKEPPPPADPNLAVAKQFGGKVWADEKTPASGGEALKTWLGSRPAGGEIARKSKDGPWTVSYVAVFKKPAAKGPITVQFYDKEDPKNVVDQDSPSNDAATLIYHGTYELDPDHGFNKGRTYVIKVGQIIKGKFLQYASAELKLK
ncbi:MAG TPA: hypothetical protein VN914_01465 [Polyangia bacterium]|nr:hypothetical protein [Polyangia bacterium]